MKQSNYNTVLSIASDMQLVFNALSDSFVCLYGESSFIENMFSENLNSDAMELRHQLLCAGFLVDDSIDERKKLIDLNEEIENDDTVFILHINPTLDCNFKCWYCYENHVPNSSMSEDCLENIISFCKSTVINSPKLKHFNLSFFGGEPLLERLNVLKLIERISQICSNNDVLLNTSFTTNGYLIDDEFIDRVSKYRPSFQITLDGGRLHHNANRHTDSGEGSYDTILYNITKLLKNGLRVILRINYTAKNAGSLNEVVEFIESISNDEREFITIDFQRVWQDKGRHTDSTDSIVKNIRSSLRENGYNTYNNRIINGVRNPCYGDMKNYVLINYNGDIFGCTARDFDSIRRLGHLTYEGIKWNGDKRIKRRESKFKNAYCLNCNIAPICGAGCRQQTTDNDKMVGCMFQYTDHDKAEFVLERFEERFMNVKDGYSKSNIDNM